MANYLLMCHGSTVKKWLFSLPTNYVDSWQDLKCRFINNFSIVCDQEKTQYDLKKITPKVDESLCSYIKRWGNVKADISSMLKETTIYVFYKGLRDQELSQKLVHKTPTTLASLFQVVGKYAMSKEILQHMSSS